MMEKVLTPRLKNFCNSPTPGIRKAVKAWGTLLELTDTQVIFDQ
jgi:hypothetical protein